MVIRLTQNLLPQLDVYQTSPARGGPQSKGRQLVEEARHRDQWRDQRQDQALQRAESFPMDQADHHQRRQHQHRCAPGKAFEHRQQRRVTAHNDID
jgi:hypothetical protein